MLDAIKEKVGDAVDTVKEAVKDTAMDVALKLAETEVEKQTGRKIEFDTKGDIPADWKEWIMKTGVNSVCCDSTWDFLEKSPYNQRKVDLWEKRDIKKINFAVDTNPDEDMSAWAVCTVDWKEGENEFTVTWLPRAIRWASDASWIEPGRKTWWIIRDEIVFGLQLYQLPGKCFYKSDWLDGVEDPMEDNPTPIPRTEKVKRWFQFRHWVIYWYKTARWGWNYQWTTTPPPNPDGSLFSMDSVLSLPDMPDFSMPSISLPSLPDVSMPSLPDAPSISAPSLSAPSLSAPDLSNLSMPSIPEQPKRPKNKWACHGFIEMNGLKVKAKGKTLVLSDAKITNFWQASNGHGIDTKTEEHKRMELECVDEEQAASWEESLVGGGAEVGEVGGCCTVA